MHDVGSGSTDVTTQELTLLLDELKKIEGEVGDISKALEKKKTSVGDVLDFQSEPIVVALSTPYLPTFTIGATSTPLPPSPSSSPESPKPKINTIPHTPTITLKDDGSSFALTTTQPPLDYNPTCCVDSGEVRVNGQFCYLPVITRVMNQVKSRNSKSYEFIPLEDEKGVCGKGEIEMQLDTNPAVYLDYDVCLDFTRAISNTYRFCSNENDINFHIYWSGPVHYQLLQAVRSFLATQDLQQSELWVWSREVEPLTNPQWVELVAIASKNLKWKNYDLKQEMINSPLEGNGSADLSDISDDLNWVDSDLFRLLILHNYGGVYMDADIILHRDLAPIIGREWFGQWGSSCNYANGAMTRLKKKSDLAKALLTLLSATPAKKNSFNWGRNLYHKVWRDSIKFDILPACFTDIHWMYDTTWVHAPYPMNFAGPFATHIHGMIWTDCIAEGEPLDLISKWYTGRIRERLGDISELQLPRRGDRLGGKVCDSKKLNKQY